MTSRTRRLTTIAAALVAAIGTLGFVQPADAGHRSRASCDRGYAQYESSRYRALHRARWQSGQYGTYRVHRGRVYGGYGDSQFGCADRPVRRRHVSNRDHQRRHRGHRVMRRYSRGCGR